MSWSRRQFLGALGAGAGTAAGTGALAGCGGSSGGGGGGGDGEGLTFVLWGADSEIAAFQAVADAFEAKTGTPVAIDNLPYADILTTVDSRLQAGDAPDLFRVSYIDIGRYTSIGALANISGDLPDGYADAFTPALWSAVNDPDGNPVGVPHHTDVTALVYNVQAWQQAGITAPTSLDQAWSWEEYLEAMERVKTAVPGSFPFAVNWQAAGAFRWLSFLAQAGGSVYGDDDLTQVTMETDEAVRALEYTKSFYDRGLHDPTFLVQAANYPDEAFPGGAFTSVYAGDFLLPTLDETVTDFEFGATFLPRDADAATDLGGNAVVVPADAPNAAAAAQFCAFLANAENMRAFCEATTVLPTRSDVTDLNYSVRPDLMPVFVEQATTIPESLVATSTSPNFTGINEALQQQLEACFGGGQPVEETLANLQSAIEELGERG